MNYIDYSEIIEALTEANVPDGNDLEDAINKNENEPEQEALIGSIILGIIQGYMEGRDGESASKIAEDARQEFNRNERRSCSPK